MKLSRRFALTCIAAALAAVQVELAAQTAEPLASPESAMAASDEAAQPAFSQEQIEQMVAPIALYPDALLVQVLMSSTYPLEVVQASRWAKKNPDLKGEALDAALVDEPWDPSVKTMVLFPTVLQRMNDNLDWTQDLGDAFLAQEQDVMDAVQRLRREAQQTGALQDTEQQKVIVEKETIIVQPADPQTVYVPTYDPAQVYGTPAPSTVYYPTVYQQPVYTSTSSSDQWVGFGVGLLVGGLLTAAILWDDHDHHVYHYGPGYWGRGWKGPRYGSSSWNSYRNTNINIYGDVNIGTRERTVRGARWEHNVEHRAGVKYRDRERVAARHPEVSRPRPAGAIDRDTARGRDTPKAALGSGDRRPAAGVADRDKPAIGGGDRRPAAGAGRDKPAVGGGREKPAVGAGDRRPAAGVGDRAKPAVGAGDRGKPAVGGGDRDRPAATARPATREAKPQDRTQAKDRSAGGASKGTAGQAFQKRDTGSFERKASERGATSRQASSREAGSRNGGGAARAGGGGASRPSGGGRAGGGGGRAGR